MLLSADNLLRMLINVGRWLLAIADSAVVVEHYPTLEITRLAIECNCDFAAVTTNKDWKFRYFVPLGME